MEKSLQISKIKTCVVGSGDWGSKVGQAVQLVNRYTFLGNINSSTSTELKEQLLNDADLIYVAVPRESQFEYVDFAVKNNKYCICESPFLNDTVERKKIYDEINLRTYTKLCYINFPYFLDKDFSRIVSKSLMEKESIKFASIKCSGNKFADNPQEAKRMYINQALNLIISICGFLNHSRIDKFIIHDDNSGEIRVNDMVFLFSWSYSDEPELEYTIKSPNGEDKAVIIYDQYDQIIPLLIMFSDRARNVLPPIVEAKKIEYLNIQELNAKMMLSTYLLESTAEFLTEKFMEYAGEKIEISDLSQLFFNGGFQNVTAQETEKFIKDLTNS